MTTIAHSPYRNHTRVCGALWRSGAALAALLFAGACGAQDTSPAAAPTPESSPQATSLAPDPAPRAANTYGVLEAQTHQVASPDGSLVISLSADEGHIRYRVLHNGEEIVAPSRIGFRFTEGGNLDDGFFASEVTTNSVDETWEQPWGERRFVRDQHNEVAVLFAAENAIGTVTLRARAFDDAVAFRMEVDVEDDAPRALIDELTEFRIDPASSAWWTPATEFNRYEYITREGPVTEASRAHTPFTVKLPGEGPYLAFHEAALVDYSGMFLDQRRDGAFEAELAPWSDGVKVRTAGDFTTPWRTIQVGDAAVDLINGTDVYLNLNEPNALGDVSWVEPMKYIGIWWGMHTNDFTWGSGPNHGATTERTKQYIDFAAEHGFGGVLVEGWNIGWDGDWFHNADLFSFTETYPDFDIEAVTDYAREKGVILIGHHETSGGVTNYENQLEDALDLYQRLGVTAIKSGYVADASDIERVDADGVKHYEWHYGQFMVNHHQRVIEEAAERGIAMNPHEPVKDTGLRRTYPNWVTREGARGQEFNAWGTPPNPVDHIAQLAFTRMLSGPFDYTPGIFNLDMNRGLDTENRVRGTLARELGLYVVIYSPLQMAADMIENYARDMAAFQFIKDVPVDWEESIALAGAPGDFIVQARQERGSADWYLGAATDDDPRDVDVLLDFLDPTLTYTATIYADGEGADWETNPYPVSITQEQVTASTVLTLALASGGGAAVQITANE